MDWITLQNQAQLWQLYLKELQKLNQVWAELLWQSLGNTSTKVAGDRLALSEVTNLYWEIYEKTLGSFLQSPTLGYTREFNSKLLQGFDSWMNFSKASYDYQIVLADVWLKTFEELIRKLSTSQENSETIENWRQFLQVWSSAFDKVFAQTFGTEDALQVRGKFLNAAMTYRFQQQQIVEVFLKMSDLPIRSEVDEMHRSIYELRKEVKSLKKALAQSQSDE
jgi:class III poly(R)-hydroxyalkanoic acid synthase PhaE subunit